MEEITNITKKLTELHVDNTTPSWAKVLILCISELVNIVKKNDTLNDRVAVLEDISEVRRTVISNLQKENETLKDELALVKQSVDNNEQKSRSSCLLVLGVEENEGENTDDIVLGIVNN